MTADTIIEPTTDAVTVGKIQRITRDMVPATLFATGLATTEEVDIRLTPDNGTTVVTAIQDATTVVLSATNTMTSINSPMTISILKDATAGAAGVFMSIGNHA